MIFLQPFKNFSFHSNLFCLSKKPLQRAAALTFVFCIILFGVGGCAGIVVNTVASEDKDQFGRFDGVWRGKIVGGGHIQYVGSQGLRCSKENRTAKFFVNEGKIHSDLGNSKDAGGTYISSEGKFRLEIPTTGEYRGSNFNVQDPSITIVIQGNLADNVRKGLYVAGMGQLNNEGCSYKVAFSPIKRNSGKIKYREVIPGLSTKDSVASSIGDPIEKLSPRRYSYDDDIVVLYDAMSKVKTIFVRDIKYTDINGMAIGMSAKDVVKNTKAKIVGSTATDKKHRIVYNFDDQKRIKEIVLNSK